LRLVYPLPRRYGLLKKNWIRFPSGGGMKKDIDNMYYLSENMLGRTFCPLGDAAPCRPWRSSRSFGRSFEIIWTASRAVEKATEPVLA